MNIIIQKRYFLGFYYSTVKNDGLHRRSQFLMSSMRSGLTYKLATTTVSFFINIIHPSFNLNPSRILILLMKKKNLGFAYLNMNKFSKKSDLQHAGRTFK